jgi:hypothetical protein
MAHFAKVENGIVTEVIVAEQEILDTGLFGDPTSWVQTSYNTRCNVHYGPDGKPDGGVALRGNYAGIGDIYDEVNDIFYPSQPYPSWRLNFSVCNWVSPVPLPDNNNAYYWDEPTLSWVLLEE